MKAVILAGGLGTRLSEETYFRPKPLVDIGGRPILWHIMKIYFSHGIDEFIVCCGYKGDMIKDYFSNYHLHNCDITFDLGKNETTKHQARSEKWRVTLVDTGDNTMTGGRLRRVRDYIGGETFCFTYGDGVGDINISAEIAFHKSHGRQATVAAAVPPGRFGALRTAGNRVVGFEEKPQGNGGYINAGFFVLEPTVLDLIEGDDTSWEREPMETLATTDQLVAWHHDGFWRPMDTLRDRNQLEAYWASGSAPWQIWE